MHHFDFVAKPATTRHIIVAPSGIEWQRYAHSEASNEGCTSYCADGDGMTRIECWDGTRERYDFQAESAAVHAAGNYLNTDSQGEILRLSDDIETAIAQADAWMRDHELSTWMYLNGSGFFKVGTKLNSEGCGEASLGLHTSGIEWGENGTTLHAVLGNEACGSLCAAVERGVADGISAGEFECNGNRVAWAMRFAGSKQVVVLA